MGTVIPGSEISFYQYIRHAPFFEEPERFNHELEVFALNANVCSRKPI
jgi:hypothetical protein